MIGYLKGTVLEYNEQSVLLDVHDVGYTVYGTLSVLRNCALGETATLYIHTIVREQNLDLYGFTDTQEKHWFEMLIGINGIGPKAAIAILNATTIDTLVQAVLSKDSSVLTKVSGIGKKNAEKIILELESKVDASMRTQQTTNLTDNLEVFEALEALGYSPRKIQEILQQEEFSHSQLESKEKIRRAIKLLAQ